MHHHVVHVGSHTYLEVTATDAPIATEREVLDLVALTWEHGTPLILLHRAALTEAFFDLRSGTAGTVLQKLANYHLRVAALIPDRDAHGPRFTELAGELDRGRAFGLFRTHDDAVNWLLS